MASMGIIIEPDSVAPFRCETAAEKAVSGGKTGSNLAGGLRLFFGADPFGALL